MSNVVNILVELIPVIFGFSIGFVVARMLNESHPNASTIPKKAKSEAKAKVRAKVKVS